MNKKAIVLSVFIVLIAGTTILVTFFVSYSLKLKKYSSIPLNLPLDFTYTAHTGCIKTSDNSIDSITEGIEYGAEIVEFDLNFDSKNRPILSHNLPKGGEVSLNEAFSKISEFDNIKVNVDLKSVYDIKAVEYCAEKYGIVDRIFYTGVNDDFLKYIQNKTDIPYYLNVNVEKPENHSEEYLSSLVKKVKNSGAVGINFNYKNSSKELVKAFHNAGLKVSIYTVDNKADIYKILSMAPDNITTKRPDIFKEILGELK